ALVVGTDSVPGLDGLGRRGPAFVLVAAAASPDRRALLDLLHQLPGRSGPVPVVLLVTDDAPAAQLFPADCCRWATLLDVVGEPVAVPCGRCDVCRGVADDPVALLAAS
ncbi:MAG: RecQ zinc-binding, partial [Frankiaceae bacterium]|nr:RecQ zinc-binding [Frankiaceae bacterium]